MKPSGRLNRRRTLQLFGGGAAWMAISAYTPTVPIASPTSAVATSRSSPTPRAGGTLKIALVNDINALDTAHSGSSGAGTTVGNVYDTLVEYDDQRRPQSALAESWDINTAGTQIKFNLRKGVQFHSGREFTSEDVRYNVQLVRGLATVGSLSAMGNWFSDLQTPDKYTVVMTLSQPRVAMFDYFNLLFILDKETNAGPNAKTKAIGTGPFSFVEWSPGDRFTLAKNKNYWRSGTPYLDGVSILIAKDVQAASLQLESGAVDVAFPLPVAEQVRLRGDAKYQLLGGGSAIITLTLNTQRPPTSNKKFRQALSYAVDRQRVARATFLSLGEARTLPWGPTSPANEPDKQKAYAFDLDKARALVVESGETVKEIDFIYYPGTTVAAMGEIYQADLAKIGIKANLKLLELPAYRSATAGIPPTYLGIAGAQINNTVSEFDPSQLFTLSRNWSTSENPSGFKSARFTELVDAAGVERDAAKLKQVYSQLNDLLLDECHVIVPAGADSGGQGAIGKASVKGMHFLAAKGLRYTDTWIDG